MIHVSCSLCGANDHTVLFPGSGSLSELTPGHIAARKGSINKAFSYTWVRCSRCNLVYATPVPDEGQLAALYASSDQSAYVGEEQNIAATYGSYLRKHRDLIANRGSALDIGAGKGFFLKTLQQFGFQRVVGIEPSSQACAAAPSDIRPFLLNTGFDEKDFNPGSFDLISCFQTLEHVHDPVALVASCSRLLAKDGIMFCISHDVGAWGVRLLGARHPIVNAGHLTLFDRATLAKLFSRHFEVRSVFSISNRYSLGYWTSLLPVDQPLKDRLLNLFGRIGIDSVPLTLRMGNMGLLARKP